MSKSQQNNKPVKKPKGMRAVSRVKSEYPSWLTYALLAGILMVTFWCYHYSLYNQFTNWDDNTYVYENPFIKSLTSQNLKMILFSDVNRTGNYHPITMLSLALSWYFSGANPQPYYVTEIILHLLNTILVFFLSLALFKAMVKKGYGEIKGIPYLAGLCALWHGIHPMHVESVSWISERKDLLYLFFYLLGLIVYVKYLMENRKMQMFLVALLFFLSLFSKPMAIVFPFSLFIIDILLKRKIEWRLLVEKIPFIFIAGIFAYLTFRYQNASNSIIPFQFTIFQRIMIACYNYILYPIKWFVPVHLSCYYPYPAPTKSHDLPYYFYITLFATIVIMGGLLYFAYKKGENYFRIVLFGFGFYFVNVMLVLQFISAGGSITADRYSYASYIGLTFMIVYFIYVLMEKIPALKIPVIIGVTAFSCMLAYLCEARTKVWHNSETLWENVNEQYPHSIFMAYGNLGEYYWSHSDYDKAFDNYREALKLKTTNERIHEGVYRNLGSIWVFKKQYDTAIDYFNIAQKMDSSDILIYLERGYTYYLSGQNELALQDYNHGYRLDSACKPLLESRANFLLFGTKNYPAAIANYTRLIAIGPAISAYYVNRALAKGNMGNLKESIDDLNKALSIDPNNAACLFNLSYEHGLQESYSLAINYAKKAQQLGYKLPAGYMAKLQNLSKTNGK